MELRSLRDLTLLDDLAPRLRQAGRQRPPTPAHAQGTDHAAPQRQGPARVRTRAAAGRSHPWATQPRSAASSIDLDMLAARRKVKESNPRRCRRPGFRDRLPTAGRHLPHVGTGGLEPPASGPPYRRPTKLGHVPMSTPDRSRTRIPSFVGWCLLRWTTGAWWATVELNHAYRLIRSDSSPAESSPTRRRVRALGGSRTPTPFRAPTSEAGVSTSSTTSARVECRGVEPRGPGLQGKAAHQCPPHQSRRRRVEPAVGRAK